MIKRFKYKGWKVHIQDYDDSWDKKITLTRGKTEVDSIYSFKHMSDAVKKAKDVIDKHERRR